MQTIYLDISNKGVIPTIYAKQGDVGRKFEIVLTDSGLPYIPVNGSVFSIWYKGASGEGNYTDIGDKSAFSLSGNKVEVEMIVQMLSAHGDGILCLTLNSPDGSQISSWNIPYICEFVPGAESEDAKEYYTAFSESVKELSDTKTLLKKVGNPHNLLDNSDFRDPVNQRGQASYTGEYGIDRWRVWGSDTLTVNSGYITVNGSVFQYLLPSVVQNSVHTLAAKKTDGSILLYTKNPFEAYSTADNGLGLGLDNNVAIHLPTGSYLWAALYEGEYTAETLPEYQLKGYTAELLECRRYYRKIDVGNYFSGVATGSNKTASFMLQHEQKMRTTPTVTASDNFSIVVYTQTGYSTIAPNTAPYGVPAEVVCQTNTDNGINIQATFDVSGVAPENNTLIIVRTRTGYLDISADL